MGEKRGGKSRGREVKNPHTKSLAMADK